MKRSKPSCARFRRFRREVDGTVSVEAALWFPVIMVVVIFIADASMIFMNNARIMRIIQDGNREFAIGSIRTCPDLTTWIETNVRNIAPSAVASCDTISVQGLSIAGVSVQLSEMDLTGATGLIGDTRIAIVTQNILEDI